jgi:hypothetical protein
MLGRRVVPLVLLLAAAVAGCGSSSTAMPAASPTVISAPGSSATPGEPPGPSGSGEATHATGPTDTTGPTAGPTTEPTAETSAAPSGDAGSVSCAGSAENRDFFAAAAQSFSWDVYCAVLPDGWFVDTGSFRLADGGTLVVGYRGPGDVRIDLQEGAYCTTGGSACSPRDHELGPAPFGDRSGTLVTLGPNESDGYAVYVDPGAAPSWSITGKGMDQATFAAIAAALHRVPR